ncbi:hypothetical protein NDU88_009271 [Pleurodeles waltl]|uniref:Uncharacterized protein n=1 Tax=Pleurodeles waltl TaxID=8319 RepID=A0AAV7RVQ6_PLEWA|nr:hypothetical protein NDU88_009271 [Pleurodeles waltl]
MLVGAVTGHKCVVGTYVMADEELVSGRQPVMSSYAGRAGHCRPELRGWLEACVEQCMGSSSPVQCHSWIPVND